LGEIIRLGLVLIHYGEGRAYIVDGSFKHVASQRRTNPPSCMQMHVNLVKSHKSEGFYCFAGVNMDLALPR
jgi:hypothetical protein